MKPKTLKLIAFILGFLLILFIINMFILIDKNSKCMNEPLIYASKNIVKNNYSVFCSCDMYDPGGDNFKFYFDDKGIYPTNPYLIENPLNFSLP
jgi:hypothetical protein